MKFSNAYTHIFNGFLAQDTSGLSPGDRDEPNTAAARTKAVKANKPASGKQSSRSSQPQ